MSDPPDPFEDLKRIGRTILLVSDPKQDPDILKQPRKRCQIDQDPRKQSNGKQQSEDT